MGFGGGGAAQQVQYIPAPTNAEDAAAKAKRKQRAQDSRNAQANYGQSLLETADKYLAAAKGASDSTLSSGSLLALGSTLGG